MDEIDSIASRYERRKTDAIAKRYAFINPAVYMSEHEKERALIRWIRHIGWSDIEDRRGLEVGCGGGSNLRMFMRLGFAPQNLAGNELLPERYDLARLSLPEAIGMFPGDARHLDLLPESFDVVFQSTVFSSILDDSVQAELAAKMWQMAKPGGGVLWYDFIYNNPSNPDVRGVPLKRLRQLFPEGQIKTWRITLAPPLSRMVCAIHPLGYSLLNTLPLLRTHVLCWISKPV